MAYMSALQNLKESEEQRNRDRTPKKRHIMILTPEVWQEM